MGADQSINPTRGGRQTQVRSLFLMICPGINPTRGGRQTPDGEHSTFDWTMYQSHKGWTSNLVEVVMGDVWRKVSIPQGVDVKHDRYYICSRRSGVSIPQGVDVKQ